MKQYRLIYKQRTMRFKNKRIILKENPRTGTCSNCYKSIGDEYINCYGQVKIIKQTNIHHKKYHDNDLLKDAVELCVSCHSKEGHRLGQLRNIGRPVI